MVYYFDSNVVSPAARIYVGKDKFENESLIKYGLESDVWVGIASHATVHAATKPPNSLIFLDQTWDDIPFDLLQDCAQLTKANSIEGNKKDNVTIIYTPWSNLKKDGSMEVGQVSFKDPKKVKKIHVAQRENPIVNRLNKTKLERHPDLKVEKEDHLRETRQKDQAALRDKQKEELRIAKERKEKAWQRDHAYDDLHSSEALASSSNQNRSLEDEEDFM